MKMLKMVELGLFLPLHIYTIVYKSLTRAIKSGKRTSKKWNRGREGRDREKKRERGMMVIL